MPTVSVVIPTYKRPDFLVEAVESVLAQTYQDFEIIVIDDGSEDDTKSRLTGFIEKTPAAQGRTFFYEQKNSGSAIARNRGIFYSKGEYVAFLDSDDLWYPTKLEKQVKILYENPEIGVVYTDCYCGESASDPNQQGFFANANPPSGMIFERMLRNNLFWTSSLLLRKEVFILAGTFDPTLRRCQDYDLWLRICYYNPCHFIPEILGLFREHPNRITKNHVLGEHKCHAFAIQAIRWQNDKMASQRFRRRAAGMFSSIAKQYFKHSDTKNAVRCLKKAIQLGAPPLRNRLLIFLLSYCPWVMKWYYSRQERLK